MKYYIRRKIEQIRRVIRWIPVIWKLYDFDYRSAIDVFQFQLNTIGDFLDSNRAFSANAKNEAKRIKTITKLMQKVYDEDYACEYQDIMESIAGKRTTEFVKTDDGNYVYMTHKWANARTDEENEFFEKLNMEYFKMCQANQERAHELLWKLIEHNIRKWWD